MTAKRKDFLNRTLALLLREQGFDADYEQQAGAGAWTWCPLRANRRAAGYGSRRLQAGPSRNAVGPAPGGSPA